MKRLSLILPVLAVLLIGGGCSGQAPVATVDVTNTSAGDIYESTVLSLAQESYPEAVLIGYNNQGLSFDRINEKPLETDTSGIMPYWTFIFAKDQAALADNVITDEETFAVEFFNGDLFVSEGVVVRDYPLDEGSWYGEDVLLATDSDELIRAFLATLGEQIGSMVPVEHININVKPGIYEITIFSPEDTGFEAHIDPRNGDIVYWNSIEFVSF